MDKCSFCERKRSEVDFLISGATGFICDECAGRAYEIVEEENKERKKSSKFDIDSVKVKKPIEIKEFLDQYVIGQEDAKKILSVAVYNHYKRLSVPEDVQDDVEIDKSNIVMVGETGTPRLLLGSS